MIQNGRVIWLTDAGGGRLEATPAARDGGESGSWCACARRALWQGRRRFFAPRGWSKVRVEVRERGLRGFTSATEVTKARGLRNEHVDSKRAREFLE